MYMYMYVTVYKQFHLFFLCRSNSDGQPVIARALYDFNSERSGELSFLAGDELVCCSAIWGIYRLVYRRSVQEGILSCETIVHCTPVCRGLSEKHSGK